MSDREYLIYRLEQVAQHPLCYDASVIREAIAALSRSEVPAGWKLVPVDPAASMVDAGVKHEPWSDYGRVRTIYRSMLAAAPSAPRGASRDD